MSDEAVSKYFKDSPADPPRNSSGLPAEDSTGAQHHSSACSDDEDVIFVGMAPVNRAAVHYFDEGDWRSDTDSESERSSSSKAQQLHHSSDSKPFASVSQITGYTKEFRPNSATGTTPSTTDSAASVKETGQDFTTLDSKQVLGAPRILDNNFIHQSPISMTKRRAEESPERVAKKNGHGPSQGAGVLDSRARLYQEREYQKRIAPYIDGKIRDEVEEEGGITPAGRLFKTILRMFEEGKVVVVEEEGKVVVVEEDEEAREAPGAEIARLTEEVDQLKKKLENVKKALTD